MSETKHNNTGVPQGCVMSPIPFTLYTNNYIIKFADDTVILNLLHKDMDPYVYHDEISTFIKWGVFGSLTWGKWPVVIRNQAIIQVSLYKYLGVHIDNILCWKTHIDNLYNRLQQRLYFLRRLSLYCVSSQIMLMFTGQS